MAREPEPGDKPQPSDIDEERASRVGRRLREIFDETLAEPMPDVFADLLKKLS